MTLTEFFIKRAKNNSELKGAIPELEEVIDSLVMLQDDKLETLFFIENWLKSKYKDTGLYSNDGEYIEHDLRHIDYSERNKYISWIWEYLNNLFINRKSDKTISLGYAYNYLTMYYNSEPTIGFGKIIDIPDITIDDIYIAIDNEDSQPDAITKILNKHDIDTVKRICSEKTKIEEIEKFLRCGTSLKLQLRDQILCRDIVNAIMPMIDKKYFLFLEKDDKAITKAEWLHSIFKRFALKTYKNEITVYYYIIK